MLLLLGVLLGMLLLVEAGEPGLKGLDPNDLGYDDVFVAVPVLVLLPMSNLLLL